MAKNCDHLEDWPLPYLTYPLAGNIVRYEKTPPMLLSLITSAVVHYSLRCLITDKTNSTFVHEFKACRSSPYVHEIPIVP
jgi:hypothetical protein